MRELPVLGLSLGDATGIGPEISARLLAPGTLREPRRGALPARRCST